MIPANVPRPDGRGTPYRSPSGPLSDRGDDMFKIEKGEKGFWLALAALTVCFVALAFTLFQAMTVLR